MVSDSIILSIILMLVASAFFSGLEIAFLSSNKLKMELEKKNNTFTSRMVSVFTRKPANFISTMLIGNNIALVVYGVLMTKYLEPIISNYWDSNFGVLLINTIISTSIILVAAEFIPKALFRLRPNVLLNFFAIPVFIFYVLFYPITIFTIWISRCFIKIVLRGKVDDFEENRVFGKLDLDNLIQEHSFDDNEDDTDKEIKLFRNALDFSDIKIRECMVPRTDIIALSQDSSLEELSQLFIETGFSRVLIYSENIDNIIAYVHSSVLFKKPNNITECFSELIIVPETMQAHKLLKLFTSEHKSISLVVDEFGGTSGIVTLEDVMEEIFGEIEDEHDSLSYIEMQISDSEFRFSGRLKIDYLNEKYRLNIEDSDEYETLAGWILYEYQDIPIRNQEIEVGNFLIKILKVSNLRIDEVLFVLK